MDAKAAERAAQLILDAWRAHRGLERLPEECTPRSLEDGYAVQDALERLDGRPLGGWKIGATNAEMQKKLGAAQPFPGCIFAPTIRKSPVEIATGDFISIGVEPEFALRLGQDLPPRAALYTRADVAAAVSSVHPACELVEPRLRSASGIASIVADNGFNAGLVYAEGTADWRHLDLAAHRLTLIVSGARVGEGTGAAALGHPLDSLAWLANDRSRRGRGLARGQFISTGTCAGVHWLTPGEKIEADFGSLGAVRISVS
jgi:2-keto-4-pentenoate hydratase